MAGRDPAIPHGTVLDEMAGSSLAMMYFACRAETILGSSSLSD
jgi:hypothetical protein